MYIVTGGAGFIGSALVWGLNKRGIEDILVVDRLNETDKWGNLPSLRFSEYLDKDDFVNKLESGTFNKGVSAILHMGACSATTERDAAYLMENNYRYTARIASWWEKNQNTRFIYASSAATYGDGSNGYSDNHDSIKNLRPMNMYGYSKQLFDVLALNKGWLNRIAGMKYFNVYGPNENHKGDMRSVINKAYPQVRDEGRMRLFKSFNSKYQDGEQERDFLYVKDAVEMTLFFLDNPGANGIFNIGSGTARTWNDVAGAIFSALNKKVNIDYIPMPEQIRDKYQYHTCADLTKIRSAGCNHLCVSLEEGIEDYLKNYLVPGAHLDACV